MRPLRSRSDAALRALAARGDAAAFAVLYERHHQALYRFCRSILRHDEDARDALHNAMVKAWAALQHEERDIPPLPWLFRIAHNEAISLLRRRRAHGGLEEADAVAGRSLEDTVELRGRLAGLQADLAALPERQRSALLLRELCGLGHDEIGTVLEVPSTSARQSIHEARVALHEAEAGRRMACTDVQRVLSDGDGRIRRGRRIRGHLRSCDDCAAFSAELSVRPGQLAAFAPPLPAAASAGLLARVLSDVGVEAGAWSLATASVPAAGAGAGAATNSGAGAVAASLVGGVAGKVAAGALVVGAVGGIVVAAQQGERAVSAPAPAPTTASAPDLSYQAPPAGALAPSRSVRPLDPRAPGSSPWPDRPSWLRPGSVPAAGPGFGGPARGSTAAPTTTGPSPGAVPAAPQTPQINAPQPPAVAPKAPTAPKVPKASKPSKAPSAPDAPTTVKTPKAPKAKLKPDLPSAVVPRPRKPAVAPAAPNPRKPDKSASRPRPPLVAPGRPLDKTPVPTGPGKPKPAHPATPGGPPAGGPPPPAAGKPGGVVPPGQLKKAAPPSVVSSVDTPSATAP